MVRTYGKSRDIVVRYRNERFSIGTRELYERKKSRLEIIPGHLEKEMSERVETHVLEIFES